ncbi:hypothetical protein GCM10020001_045180 [Nonomuraea salmonea]
MERLRHHLLDTGYTIDGVRERLGATAASALAREELTPALRATAGGDPLGTLIRLWWLGVPVPAKGVASEVLESGLVAADGDQITATVHLQPWETGGYVVSDRKVRPGDPALRPDHVVGAGGASANLAQLVTRRPAGSALDLGTGCGVQGAAPRRAGGARHRHRRQPARAGAGPAELGVVGGSPGSMRGWGRCTSRSRVSGSTWW